MSDDENSPMTESSSIQTRQQASNFKENRENLQENKNLNNLENESSKSLESKTKLKVNIKGMKFYFASISIEFHEKNYKLISFLVFNLETDAKKVTGQKLS